MQGQCALTGDHHRVSRKVLRKVRHGALLSKQCTPRTQACARVRAGGRRVERLRFTDINIFVGAVIFVGLIYCGVSLCGGGRITANISPPYRTKIEYFIRRRDINNSYSRPVFSGQLKSFCRIDDISYARGSSDTGSVCTAGSLRVSSAATRQTKSSSRFIPRSLMVR